MTHGILTIIENYDIKYKIIVGHDAYDLFDLFNTLREYIKGDDNIFTTEKVYDFAANNFDRESLVVLSENECMYKGDDEISDLYRETFYNVYFNPRWKNGTGFTLIWDITGNTLKWD